MKILVYWATLRLNHSRERNDSALNSHIGWKYHNLLFHARKYYISCFFPLGAPGDRGFWISWGHIHGWGRLRLSLRASVGGHPGRPRHLWTGQTKRGSRACCDVRLHRKAQCHRCSCLRHVAHPAGFGTGRLRGNLGLRTESVQNAHSQYSGENPSVRQRVYAFLRSQVACLQSPHHPPKECPSDAMSSLRGTSILAKFYDAAKASILLPDEELHSRLVPPTWSDSPHATGQGFRDLSGGFSAAIKEVWSWLCTILFRALYYIFMHAFYILCNILFFNALITYFMQYIILSCTNYIFHAIYCVNKLKMWCDILTMITMHDFVSCTILYFHACFLYFVQYIIFFMH